MSNCSGQQDCDTDHYLVEEIVRKRLTVSKQIIHRFHMEGFSVKQLNKIEGRQQYCVENSITFAALENLGAEVEINRTWETIRISAIESVGYYELKKLKLWFKERCSELLDRRKQAKLQWLQEPSEINEDNQKNIRHEASRHFRNRKREYLKD
jgi:hypothetical protein